MKRAGLASGVVLMKHESGQERNETEMKGTWTKMEMKVEGDEG